MAHFNCGHFLEEGQQHAAEQKVRFHVFDVAPLKVVIVDCCPSVEGVSEQRYCDRKQNRTNHAGLNELHLFRDIMADIFCRKQKVTVYVLK